MPKNETKKNLTAKQQSDSARKAPGTRIGTLFDWREGAIKSVNQHHGQTVRDGR